MRIVIAAPDGLARDTGLGRYCHELLAALREVAPEHRVTPRAPGLGRRLLGGMGKALRLPFGGPDIWHALDDRLPSLRAKRVLTVRDLAFLTHPEDCAPRLVRQRLRALTHALAHADAIVTVSKYLRRALLDAFPDISPARITAIPPGVSPIFASPHDEACLQAAREQNGVRQPFVMAVGTRAVRNNYLRLLAAFAQARRMSRAPQQLVIVGRRGYGADQIDAAIQRLDLADHTIQLEAVPEIDLIALYTQAACVAQVSYTAGSALAALEAMRGGAPLVVSDGGAAPELAGDAALIAPGDDPDALAHALHRAVADADVRHHLRVRGQARAARFTWEKTASATLRVYESLG